MEDPVSTALTSIFAVSVRRLKCGCTGKGKATKAKGRGSKSALRDEFDRQSEEEEAAERAAFSTPGFSDDGKSRTHQTWHPRIPQSESEYQCFLPIDVDCKRQHTSVEFNFLY